MSKKSEACAKKCTSKYKLDEHAGKYNVLKKLAYAPAKLKFTQLRLANAEESMEDLRHILTGRTSPRRAIYSQSFQEKRRLQVIPVKVHGTNV